MGRRRERSILRRKWAKTIEEEHDIKPGDLDPKDSEKLFWFVGHELHKRANVGEIPSRDIIRMSVELVSYFIPRRSKLEFEDAKEIIERKADEYKIKRNVSSSNTQLFREILNKMEEDGTLANLKRALKEKRTISRRIRGKD